ncbi:hypothetical protein HNP46_004300 [Pseudomonas nitritireducens]|uniref:Uncharacterized protein n=1 Tax=Pseudomonas nitroreducens TaxID=46680 RepID=A0A7W7KN64_PSENT|nr:hypothetical protein [Pseudomonas nitritireducens]MBB4865419.1 hypothetical protein [Pseudomonas nitritireducens]
MQQHYTAHYDLSLEGIKTWYDQGHSLSQSAQADLYGIDADGNDVSLSDQNLKDYFFLPIRIRPGLHKYAELFVLDDYTDLDESRLVRVETLDAEPGITLGELVHTILMDINLDDADDLRELIQSRIDDLVVDFPENLDD